MSGGRRKRQIKRLAVSDPTTQPLVTDSASRRVYQLIDLRIRIFQLLDGHELAIMMRVEKKGMSTVASEMYQYMVDTDIPMKNSTHLCRNGGASYPTELLSEILSRSNSDIKLEIYATYELVVFPIRKKCPGLLSARWIPDAERPDIWSFRVKVHFDPTKAIAKPATQSLEGCVHVETHALLIRTLSQAPPAANINPIPQSQAFTQQHRFNLKLLPLRGDPDHTEEWLEAIRSNRLKDLSTEVRLSTLPVAIVDLTRMLNHCREQGGSPLQVLFSEYVTSFDLGEFEDLAYAGWTSLRHLSLARKYDERAVKVSFGDIPRLVEIVGHCLPCLEKLDIALSGIQTAENVTGPMLHPDILDTHGTIAMLSIVTSNHATPLWNTIRALSPLVSYQGMISVGTLDRHWIENDQHDFLRHLHQLPPESRQILSTIDFQTLDMYKPSMLPALIYHEDGRPRLLRESNAEDWVKATRRVQLQVGKLTEALSAATMRAAKAAERVAEISASASTGEMIANIEAAAEASEEMERAAAQITKLGNLLKGLTEEMEKFCADLKRGLPPIPDQA